LKPWTLHHTFRLKEAVVPSEEGDFASSEQYLEGGEAIADAPALRSISHSMLESTGYKLVAASVRDGTESNSTIDLGHYAFVRIRTVPSSE
jgi:hypothetical protein